MSPGTTSLLKKISAATVAGAATGGGGGALAGLAIGGAVVAGAVGGAVGGVVGGVVGAAVGGYFAANSGEKKPILHDDVERVAIEEKKPMLQDDVERVQIEEKKPMLQDDVEQVPIEEKKPMLQDDVERVPIEDKKPMLQDDVEQVPIEDKKPMLQDDVERVPIEDKKPMLQDDVEQVPIEDKKPMLQDDVEPVPMEDKKPRLQDDVERVPIEEKKPMLQDDVERVPIEDKKPRLQDDVERVPIEEKKPMLQDDVERVPIEEKKPMIQDDVEPVPIEEKKPMLQDDVEPVPIEDKKPRLQDDVEPVLIEDKKPMLQDDEELVLIETPHFKVSEVVVNKIKQTKRKVKEYVKTENMVNDATKMRTMVLASKENDFETVEEILKEKKHLINGIPAERSWSALHQAVYLQNFKAVQMLLKFDNCDLNVRAKWNSDGITQPGDTPIKLEKSGEIEKILKKKQKKNNSHVPTFIKERLGKIYIKEGIPLYLMSPAFLQDSVAKQIPQNYKDFLGLTQMFFELLRENFTTVKSSLADSLYPFDERLFMTFAKIDKFDDFVKEIIYVYTTNNVYAQVNLALKRSSEKLNPTGDDLLLCLYAFMLETFLLNGSFPAYSGTTYRRTTLNSNQLSMYKVGTTFYWMSFSSSSKEKDLAFPANVKFIIDNHCNSKWKPRDIISCSLYPGEAEMLYPAGAKFRVTSVIDKVHPQEIFLKLIE